MSRIFTSSFSQQRTSKPAPNLDHDPLLPLDAQSERSNSISLQNLSPQVSHSPAASPSPPPSFYRLKSPNTNDAFLPRSNTPTLSPSPSRTKGREKGRVIQFAAPPPPIVGSVLLPRNNSSSSGSRPHSSADFDGSVGASRIQNASPQTGLVRRRGSGASIADPLLGLERRERAIQKELQKLLDAQSAGLIQGFGGADGSGSEAGSSTPTYNSTRSRSAGRREGGGVVPVRQPKQKPISLRGARRGLLRDIGELADIKGEEVVILEDSIAQRENVLRKVAVWEQRIQSFQRQLSSTASGNMGEGAEDEEGRELAELRNEEKAVENEIREMEDRLAQMRARRKWIQEKVREGENRREARLSSYRGALREVEGEVREFLRRPPVFAAPSASDTGEEEGFMQLPVGRRTLGMAKELWTREISSLQTRRTDIEKERKALDQGAKMWESSVRAVMEFEDGLREQMKGNMRDTEMLRSQVQKMGNVIGKLEENLRAAEGKGWNLLICALGAELEAFKEGEGILRGALGMVEGVGGGVSADDGVDNVSNMGNGLEELNELEDKGKGLIREESGGTEDSEDDGPNLEELLVDNSHGDGENSID